MTPWGAVEPWDGSAPLDWAVAADDRWHRPAAEPTVRQRRVAGTPVVETRVRIPGGDAVQQVWSVADGAGCTLVEIANESPLPIAVAFTRPDVLTSRPPTGVPIEGIDLPAGSVLVPIGHRSRVVVGLAHDGRGPGPLPAGLAPPDAVVRGWQTLVERAGQLDLPEGRWVDMVAATRAELLLAGVADPGDDPVAFLIGVGELVRLGELDQAGAGAGAPDVAAAVEAVARTDGWEVDAALGAAARVLHHAGDGRAVGDVGALVARRGVAAPVPVDVEPPSGPLGIAFVERLLAADGSLLPSGWPTGWRGAPIEARRLPVGLASTLSFAIRWHGEHPAVLWEVTGPPAALSAPVVAETWQTTAPTGETLWRTVGGGGGPVT